MQFGHTIVHMQDVPALLACSEAPQQRPRGRTVAQVRCPGGTLVGLCTAMA